MAKYTHTQYGYILDYWALQITNRNDTKQKQPLLPAVSLRLTTQNASLDVGAAPHC